MLYDIQLDPATSPGASSTSATPTLACSLESIVERAAVGNLLQVALLGRELVAENEEDVVDELLVLGEVAVPDQVGVDGLGVHVVDAGMQHDAGGPDPTRAVRSA